MAPTTLPFYPTPPLLLPHPPHRPKAPILTVRSAFGYHQNNGSANKKRSSRGTAVAPRPQRQQRFPSPPQKLSRQNTRDRPQNERGEDGEEKKHCKEGEFPGSRFMSQQKQRQQNARQRPHKQRGEELEKKKHWKEGEFPGSTNDGDSLVMPRNTQAKNAKKGVEDRVSIKAWAPTVTETLTDLINKKQWENALQVFDVLKEQPFYQPREGTYMKFLVLLGKSGQAGRAHQLFDTMVEEGIDPTPELYTALLASYCRSNFIDGAFTVLNKMKTMPNCQPDVYTYSTLIKACVQESRFELVDSLFHEMSERGITPNTVTQNTVLGGYGKAGKFEMMEKVLSTMIESDTCKPDAWTMNTIISLFGNKGQIDMMEKWYEKFRSIGIEPETRTFNILIGCYGKKKMYDKMTSVMEYMRKLDFPWTTSTYNNVIEAFADVGDAKNMEDAFEQMRAERMKVDTKTFVCLIKGFSNAGVFHKVVSSIKLAEKLEVPTNTLFYNAVISACAEAGDLLEMERVFNHMKAKHHTPDSVTYCTMTKAYEKEGMIDKIYDLEQEKKSSVHIPVIQ